MADQDLQNNKPENKFSFFDYLFEIIGWLQIVVSPLLLGLLIGAGIYFTNPTTARMVAGIAVAVLGLTTGIIIATRAWKGKGTIHLISRDMATPELDELEEDKHDRKNI